MLQEQLAEVYIPEVQVTSIDNTAAEGTTDWSYFNIERTEGAPEEFSFNISMVGTGANPADENDGSWKYKDASENWVDVPLDANGDPEVTMMSDKDILEIAFVAVDDGISEGTETGDNTVSKTASTNSNLVMVSNTAPTTIEDAEAAPITLEKFEVDLVDRKYPHLHWTTASEINNDFFRIERSFDGKRFDAIAIVKSQAANGTSTASLDYGYTDYTEDLNGTVYYRFAQVDQDGTETLGPLRSVKVEGRDIKPVLSPNPVDIAESVNLKIYDKGQKSYKILNLQGQVMASGVLDNGNNSLDLAHLLPGIYFVHVEGGEVLKLVLK